MAAIAATPPEWQVVPLNWGYQIVAGNRVIAAIAGHTADPRDDAQAAADARLIRAAPHLVNAGLIALAYARTGTQRRLAEEALRWALEQAGIEVPT